MSNPRLYDTTLRDGTQGEGISFSVADKLLIVERLDQFGVDYIEGGFPGSNPRDISFFAEAAQAEAPHARSRPSARPAGRGPRRPTIRSCALLLDSGMPVLTIVGKTWLMHVTEVLRTTRRRTWR
jgi:2-isopropylmalate synthase